MFRKNREGNRAFLIIAPLTIKRRDVSYRNDKLSLCSILATSW